MALLRVWLVLAASLARELELSDECSQDDCSFSALQRRARKEASDCKDVQGDDATCNREVSWAKQTGVKQHPEWYPGLSEGSSPLEFQCKIFRNSPWKCPKPCGVACDAAPAAPAAPPPSNRQPDTCAGRSSPDACLCVFDIDRTLTSKQGLQDRCEGSRNSNTFDSAYGGGKLVLSQIAASGLAGTFCSKCYVGVVSHGDGSGKRSAERKELMQALETEAMKNLRLKPFNAYWSDMEMKSPFYVDHPDARKQEAVFDILDWYAAQEVCIAHGKTYFFDDKDENILPFQGTGLNAKQISCSSRDAALGQGDVGLCGATSQEITAQQGVSTCKIDCEFAAWSAWTTCSKSCGGGRRARQRHVLVKNRNGGKECGAASEAEDCNPEACPMTATTTTTPATTSETAAEAAGTSTGTSMEAEVEQADN